jgi:acetate kinase
MEVEKISIHKITYLQKNNNMQKIIIINSGSVSKKYALYEGQELLLSAHFEILPKEFQIHLKKGDDFSKSERISKENFDKAFDFFIDLLINKKIIEKESDIVGVAFRIVAPGLTFQKDQRIDKNYLSKIDEITENSLIHIKAMREEMNQVIDRLPKTAHFAISDSSFHVTNPEHIRRYAISNKITEAAELYRYGYHGISVSSIVENLKIENKLPSRMIVCHLGGGASLTAVLNGKSLENSMGYTPLEGIPMSTRCGNIDAGAVLAMIDYEDYDSSEMKEILFNESGLQSVSEVSSDTRDLIEQTEAGNKKAALALDMYTHSIKKYIGAYIAILGGLDLIVFTATVGERSYKIREKICVGLEHLGIKLDLDLNKKLNEHEGYINKPGSEVSILIKKTDEMAEMARRTYKLLESK